MDDWTARFRGIKGEPLVQNRVKKYFRNQNPYTGTEQFVDEEFPPNKDSLLSERCCWDGGHRVQVDNMGEWTFKRCSELLGPNFCVYDNHVGQSDIKQGQLGDCYFLASLAAMTEFPGLIQQNFKLGGHKSSNGYYEIMLFIDEEWQIVIVDDFIPCLINQGPAFCQPTRNVIWMLLLEKAWAKINDGWSNIIAGKSVWPMHIITGFPCSLHNFHHHDKETLWKMLSYANSRNDIMTCAAFKEGNGIYGSHQYTLRFAGEIKDRNGDIVRLVCVRNPWGRGEWQGDWSDNSDLWTPALRNQLGVHNRDDGVFYMSYDDFLQYFNSFEIAHSPNFYKNSSLFSHSDSSPKIYNIRVEDHTTLTVNAFAETEFRCSIFLSKYDADNKSLENKEASIICSATPFEGRIYNLTNPGHYIVAVYPHEEKNFKVRFSSNGKHIVNPVFQTDKNLTFLSHIKLSKIPDIYYKLTNDTEISKFIHSVEEQICDLGEFCQIFDSLSINENVCSDFKLLSSINCSDPMTCVISNMARFVGDCSYNDEFSEGSNQGNNNFNFLDSENTDEYPPVIFENSKLLRREKNCNYNYLTVNFPNRDIKRVELIVTMRDQGWSTDDNSGSWIDAVIYNQNGDVIKSKIIFQNLAVPQFTEYKLVINHDHELWPYMNMNYRMNLFAKSDWGWEIWVSNAKCIIH